MSPAQLFHFPHALKRDRNIILPNQGRQVQGKDKHSQHQINGNEIHATRNRLVKSRVKKTKPSASFSDASARSVSYNLRDSGPPQIPELHLKPSSIFLDEEAVDDVETSSIRSAYYLRNCASSSSLRSYYDARNVASPVPRQTFESVRSHLIPRRNSPAFAQSPSPDVDPAHTRYLTPSRLRETESNVMSMPRPSTSTGRSQLSSPDYSFRSSDWDPISNASTTSHSALSRSDSPMRTLTNIHSTQKTRSPMPTDDISMRFKSPLLHPMDPSFVKVNVRRPKPGAEHWFDNLEDETSEDEVFHEAESNKVSVEIMDISSRGVSKRGTPSPQPRTNNHYLDHNLSYQRISPPLSQDADHSTLPRTNVTSIRPSQLKSPPSNNHRSQSRRRSKALNKANLKQDSVLDLSSSDEEDEFNLQPQRPAMTSAWPVLRDSIARDSFTDSEIEIGTAQTVSTHRPHAASDASQVRVFSLSKPYSPSEEPQTATPYRPNIRVSTDQPIASTDNAGGQDDLLSSFPATPVDSPVSHRTSTRCSTIFSDSGSIESRRLVSVTKQEETFLAALRLRKIAREQDTLGRERSNTLNDYEPESSDRPLRPNVDTRDIDSQSQHGTEPDRSNRSSMIHQRWSLNGDVSGMYSRSSSTTFNTNTSHNPSRLSRATFQTDVSNGPGARSSMLSERGIDLYAPRSRFSWNTADRRASVNTFVSTSSGGHPRYSRRFAGGNQAALDRLSRAPKRDEIPSQEFINWPYHGWEARTELGIVH